MKINISEDAKRELKNSLEKKGVKNHPLRIFIQSFG
jgi:Fe-S cluster assembly iron-binding protein IscA